MSRKEPIIHRVAIYARVSTEEQREGKTIQSQVAELERHVRDHAWPLIDTYKDEGWSGAVLARPELDRLRDDAAKGLFDTVLVNDVDRLARDVAHLGVIKRDLERLGVRTVFRKLPSEANPTNNLMINILGSFAEFERELIADRTRRGRRHKIEVEKQYLSANTAYGYLYVPKDQGKEKNGYLMLSADEAPVVREMFRWVDEESLSARRIVKRLNDRGIRPKKLGAKWAKSTVLRILRNEMYAGTWYYNKFQAYEPREKSATQRYRKNRKYRLRQRPQSEWIPLSLSPSLRLVSRDRWKRVQEQLSRNRIFSPRNEKHQYLLKGLVRCGGCGATYVGDPSHGRFYYRCAARCKRVKSILEETLNAAVKESVAKVMLHPEVILEPLRELEGQRASQRRAQHAERIQADRLLDQIEKEEQRVLKSYRMSIISPAQLRRELEQLSARRAAIHIADQPEDTHIAFSDAEHPIMDYCKEARNNLSKFSIEQWREFLRTVVRTISFYGDRITIEGRIPLPETVTRHGQLIFGEESIVRR